MGSEKSISELAAAAVSPAVHKSGSPVKAKKKKKTAKKNPVKIKSPVLKKRVKPAAKKAKPAKGKKNKRIKIKPLAKPGGRGRPGTVFKNPRNKQERIAAAVKRIRGLRLAPECAKAAGITVGYWHKIERAAVHSIPLETIQAVAGIFSRGDKGAIMAAYLAPERKGDKPFASARKPAAKGKAKGKGKAKKSKKAKAAKRPKTKKTAGTKKPAPKKKAA